MFLETQFKLKNNTKYMDFLHNNSYWYKYLNRSKKNFVLFENDVKDKMQMRLSDRIGAVTEAIEMFSLLLTKLK